MPEAAVRLGVSVDTVRRRVQAGELEKVPLQRGYAVVLNQEPSLDANVLAEVRAERDRLLDEVTFLQRQLETALLGQAAMLKLLESRTAGDGSSTK